MSAFITEAELADELDETVEKVAEWRRRYGWPHIKIGRQVRFTEADVRAIQSMHHVESERPSGLPSQTALSAARSR